LHHDWIIQNTETQLLEEVINSEALKNLKDFNSQSKLQQAALTFLTTHMITQEEMRELAKTFEALDTNNNGSLTADELLVGFT
jgi:calcium-dependent protein kinase